MIFFTHATRRAPTSASARARFQPTSPSPRTLRIFALPSRGRRLRLLPHVPPLSVAHPLRPRRGRHRRGRRRTRASAVRGPAPRRRRRPRPSTVPHPRNRETVVETSNPKRAYALVRVRARARVNARARSSAFRDGFRRRGRRRATGRHCFFLRSRHCFVLRAGTDSSSSRRSTRTRLRLRRGRRGEFEFVEFEFVEFEFVERDVPVVEVRDVRLGARRRRG